MTYEEAKNVIGQCVGCKYLFDGGYNVKDYIYKNGVIYDDKS